MVSSLFVLALEQILVRDPPVVDNTDAGVEVRGEAEPGEVGHVQPAGGLVHAKEQLGEVDVDPQEGGDVGEGDGGLPDPEEERHPRQVQPQLHRVQRRGVLGGLDAGDARGQRVQARRDGPVRRVAHESVEERPYRPEDLGRRAQGRLLHEAVRVLGLLGCLGGFVSWVFAECARPKSLASKLGRDMRSVLRTSCAESHAGAQRDGQQDRGGGILEHLAGYRQIGDIRRHGCGLRSAMWQLESCVLLLVVRDSRRERESSRNE